MVTKKPHVAKSAMAALVVSTACSIAFSIAFSIAVFTAALLIPATPADGLTANKVFFEFWPAKGIYRVRFFYTLPELKEAREGKVDFRSKQKASAYYYALLRGADFYMQDPENIEFKNQPFEPSPW